MRAQGRWLAVGWLGMAACAEPVALPEALPVADAGAAQWVAVGSEVLLDGTKSDGTAPLTFSWSLIAKPNTSAASLLSATTARPSFLLDASGAYVVRLVVHAEGVASDPAFVVVQGEAPLAVGAQSPAQGQRDVQVNTPVVVAFSEPVQPESVTPATFFVLRGREALAGTLELALGNTVAVFTPAEDLPPGERLQVTVTTDVVSLPVHTLPASFVSHFTVSGAPDTEAPAVVAVDPAHAAIEVDWGRVVTVTFSEPIAAASFNGTRLEVRDAADQLMAGAVGLDAASTRAWFTPAQPYAAGAPHQVTVSGLITDLAGNPVGGDVVTSFTAAASDTPLTVEAVYPGNGYEDVPLAATVTVIFSEPIAAASLTAQSLKLQNGATQEIQGSRVLSAGGRVATFTAASLLELNTVYQVKVSGDAGVVDVGGVALDGDGDSAPGGVFEARFVTAQERSYDGAFSVPANITPGNVFVVELTDRDLDTSSTPDLAVVQANSTNGESETVLLTETTGTSGIFEGSVTTSFGASAGPSGDGAFYAQAADLLRFIYWDDRSAAGVPARVVAATSVVGGADGALVADAQRTPGQALTVTVIDADLNLSDAASETLDVSLQTSTGETELLTLEETAPQSGAFAAAIETAWGSAGADNDGTLEVQPGDTIVTQYQDALTAAGASALLTSTTYITGGAHDGSVALTEVTFLAGASLSVTVTDTDQLANVQPGPGNDTLPVTLTSASVSDSLSLTLSEDATVPGVFRGQAPTRFAAAATADVLLQVQGADTVTVSYLDMWRTDGTTSGVPVSDTATMVVGLDAGAALTPTSFFIGQTLALSVSDDDLYANATPGAGNDQVTVSVACAAAGDTEALIASEDAAIPGLFRVNLPTSYASSGTQDGTLQCVGPGNAVLTYLDALRGNGDTSGWPVQAPSAVATGVDGAANIVQATFREGDVLTLRVSDNDAGANFNAGPGNDSLAVSLACTGSGDALTVTLAEDGATAGLFVGSVTTDYGAALGADAVLQCAGTDTASLSYTDILSATGQVSGTLRSDTASMLVGVNGSADLAVSTFRAGQALNLVVTDSDSVANPTAGPGNNTLAVNVRSQALNDTLTLTLNEDSITAGVFRGNVPTAFAASASADSTLQVFGADTVTAAYTDLFRLSGNTAGEAVSDLATMEVGTGGAPDIVQGSFVPGDAISLRVTGETDVVANASAGPNNDSVAVTVRSNTTGDTVNVTLYESATVAGAFDCAPATCSVPTTASGVPVSDGILQVVSGEAVVLTYVDFLLASGNTAGVQAQDTATAGAGAAGVDGGAAIVQATFRAGNTLTLQVSDSDATAAPSAGPGNDVLAASVSCANSGDSVAVTLVEDAATAGLFTATLLTAYGSAVANPTLECQNLDTATLVYVDYWRADGNTAGVSISDTSLMQGGVNGGVNIQQTLFRDGDSLALSITDSDDRANLTPGAGNDSVLATLTCANTGDSEVVVLAESGVTQGTFTRTLTANYGTAVLADGILQCSGADGATLSYNDQFRQNGDTRGVQVVDTATMEIGVNGTASIVQLTFRAGDALVVRVTDTDDVANSTPGAGNNQLTVTLTAQSTGDTVSVAVPESATTAGVFETQVATLFALTATADATLQLNGAGTVTLTYTDMFRASGRRSGEPVTDTATSEVGVDATADVTPATFRAGATLTLSVTDNDAVANSTAGPGNNTLSVTVSSDNTTDSETIVLSEDAATAGLFRGTIITSYSANASPDGVLQCKNADTMRLSYSDRLRANGDTRGVTVSDTSSMQTGVDGVLVIQQVSFRAGQTLNLSVTDNDAVANATPGAGNDTLTVVVAGATLADSVNLTLNESASTAGLFEGSVSTTFAAAATANAVVEVSGPDTVTATYNDRFRANGNTTGENVTDQAALALGANASVDIVQSNFAAGDTLNLSVSDNDAVANATSGPNNDQVSVTARSTATGDQVVLSLAETAAGAFSGSVVSQAGAAVSDALLQVGQPDTVILTYDDRFRANGDTRGVNVQDSASTGRVTITPLTASSSVQETTTSTSYVFTDTIIPGASLQSGVDYLVLYNAAYGGDGTSTVCEAAVYFGATVIARSADEGSSTGTPEAMRIAALHGYYVVRGDGASALRIAHRLVAPITCYITGKSLVAMPLNNLVVNQDYWLSQQNGEAAVVTATASFVSLLSATWTLPAAGNYLVLTSAEGSIPTGGSLDGEAFRTVIDGGVQKMAMGKEWEDAAANRAFSYARVHNLAAGSHELKVEVGPAQGTTTKEFRRGRVIVVRADRFDQLVSATKDTESQTSSLYPAFDNMVSLTYTPNQSEHVIVLGNTLAWQGETLRSFLIRLYDVTHGVAMSDFVSDDAKDNLFDRTALSAFGVRQLSAATTLALQISGENPSASPHHFQYGDLIVWSMTLR